MSAHSAGESSGSSAGQLRSIGYIGAKTTLLRHEYDPLMGAIKEVRAPLPFAHLVTRPPHDPCSRVGPQIPGRAPALRGDVRRRVLRLGRRDARRATAGYRTLAFDTELFARKLAEGAITPYTLEVEEALRAMEAARGAPGLITAEYSPASEGRRLFWTEDNAARPTRRGG